jgi:hypothetical protein
VCVCVCVCVCVPTCLVCISKLIPFFHNKDQNFNSSSIKYDSRSLNILLFKIFFFNSSQTNTKRYNFFVTLFNISFEK